MQAKGLEGHLLIYPKEMKDMIVFRVYAPDKKTYEDYEVRHHDLKIKLLDGFLYEDKKGKYIGY